MHMIISDFSAMKRVGRLWAIGCFMAFSWGAHAAPVRNVILCIGDGMGPEEVKAARLYAGEDLFFESFTNQSSMSTESASDPVTDSAASGSAMATGQKVNNGVVSLALPGDGSELQTVLESYCCNPNIIGGDRCTALFELIKNGAIVLCSVFIYTVKLYPGSI